MALAASCTEINYISELIPIRNVVKIQVETASHKAFVFTGVNLNSFTKYRRRQVISDRIVKLSSRQYDKKEIK